VTRWTHESVIEAIQARHAKGHSLAYTAAVAEDEALTGGARKAFGSWPLALTAAGFDPAEHRLKRIKRRSWSPESVIAGILDHMAAGHDLDAHSIQIRDGALVGAARTHLGGWDAALLAAGLDPADHRRAGTWSRTKIIHAIQRAHQHGADLSDKTADGLARDLYKAAGANFGGWRQAIEAAGLDYATIRRTREHARDGLIERLRALAAVHVPIGALCLADSGFRKALQMEFGSLDGALAAAGVAEAPPGRVAPADHVTSRLLHWRMQVGLSQEALGELVGKSHRAIGMYESGHLVPSLATAMRMAQALDMRVEVLFGVRTTCESCGGRLYPGQGWRCGPCVATWRSGVVLRRSYRRTLHPHGAEEIKIEGMT
jgi:DNA-binding XRE family transcriptional regulator